MFKKLTVKLAILLLLVLVFPKINTEASVISSFTQISGTDLSYRNSWFGNSFSGLQDKRVVHSIDAIAVDPVTGSLYTNTLYEEGGMHISQYRNGQKVKHMRDTFGYGRGGGQAVAVNTKYVFAGVTYSGNDSCAISPGTLNQNGLLNNRLCGTTWTGFARYKNTLIDGSSNESEFATFPTGYVSGGYLLVDPNNTQQYRCVSSGAVANEIELFISDYCNNKIQVYDTETMLLKREFAVPKPGKLTLDKQGNLWIMSLKDDSSNYSIGDFKYTYTDTVKILHYSPTGTKLAQEIASPQTTNARGIAINSRNDLLVAIGGEADRTNAKQQIYFYNNIQTSPTFYKTFGTENGYYGGSLKGEVRDGKFDWITGVAVDNADNIYISMQKIGVVSYKEDGTKNWQVSGLLFLDSTAVDPQNPNIYYSKWDKFEVDPNRPDGSNWKHLARIYDFKKYPEDPRNFFGNGYFDALPQKVCYLQNKKFLVMDISNSVIGYRFDKTTDGEITIPAFQIHPGDNTNPQNYVWTDANGDGLQQASEKQPDSTTNFATSYVDDYCGIWFSQGGKRAIYAGSTVNKEDYMNYYAPTALNASGYAPDYKVSTKIQMFTPNETSCQPYLASNGSEPCLEANTRSLLYDKPNDVMYISGYSPTSLSTDNREIGNKLFKFLNWLKPNRSLAWSIDLPYVNNANTQVRVASLSMSGDYIIAAEAKPPSRQFLINKSDGALKELSSSIQGNFGLGWVDINKGGVILNKRPDQTYLATVEDDNYIKSFTYYFKPVSYNSIITGQLYNDTNANGSKQTNETGQDLPAGTKIKLTNSVNSNLVFYPIINTYGDYAQSLPAGAYNVEYILPAGYAVSSSSPSIIIASSGQINNTDSAPAGIKVSSSVTKVIKPADFVNLNFKCRFNEYSLFSSQVNNQLFGYTSAIPNLTCTGLLPVDTVLDSTNGLTLKIGTSPSTNRIESDQCKVSSGSLIICLNVPVASQTANQIYIKLGNNPAYGSGYGVFTGFPYQLSTYSTASLSDNLSNTSNGIVGNEAKPGYILFKGRQGVISDTVKTNSNISVKTQDRKDLDCNGGANLCNDLFKNVLFETSLTATSSDVNKFGSNNIFKFLSTLITDPVGVSIRTVIKFLASLQKY